MNKNLKLLAALALTLAPLTVSAKITLGDLFGDNMILQRQTAAPVWGAANPGEVVTLTLTPGDLTVSATASADGKWQAVFNNLQAAPSLTLTVSGTGAGDTLTVSNVAVGEVWVGSGQSNMQFTVKELWPQDLAEVLAVSNSGLRYFESPRWMESQPADKFPPRKYKWISASPETSKEWSAVAWYFAAKLNKELGVPVGVIGCSWGGTPAEPWVAREFLESNAHYQGPVDRALQDWQNREANTVAYPDALAAWEKATGRADADDEGLQNGWAAPGFNDSGWAEVDADKLQNWQGVGAASGGVIWLRKKITVADADEGKDFIVKLGEIGGDDRVFFNGELIGRGGKNMREKRRYTAPGKLVRAGENTLTVRIFVRNGYRIYHGDFQATNPRATFGVGEKLQLPDGSPATPNWRGKASRELPPLTEELVKTMPPNPVPAAGCVPTLNFNGMVAPLMPFAIRGALWYQGESNANAAYAYRELLPLLVKSWRAHWGLGDFPFYVVQLPNFGGASKQPVDDNDWAVVRESQLVAARNTPNVKVSVNIDIGEAFDIHPHNKKDVGERLALIALADVHGKSVEWSGPMYESMKISGNKIRLKFSHADGGLVAKDGALQRFAIAGEDRQWLPADAQLDGDTVVVSNTSLSAPVAARYAWTSNPEGCNLYNQAGLPAAPFRTDNWPVVSQGFWYPEPAYQWENAKPLELPVPFPGR